MRWTGCLINWGIIKLKLIIRSSLICRHHFRANSKSKVRDLWLGRLFERRIKETGTEASLTSFKEPLGEKLIEWVVNGGSWS